MSTPSQAGRAAAPRTQQPVRAETSIFTAPAALGFVHAAIAPSRLQESGPSYETLSHLLTLRLHLDPALQRLLLLPPHCVKSAKILAQLAAEVLRRSTASSQTGAPR